MLCQIGYTGVLLFATGGLYILKDANLQGLHKAGFLHRDISMNDLIINKNTDNPSLGSFLIYLDLAIKEQTGNSRNLSSSES